MATSGSGVTDCNATASVNNTIVNTNGNPSGVQIVLHFLYLLPLLIATIIGNLLVLYLIGKHLKCTSFTNAFISSLSVSDLLGSLSCIPLTLANITKRSWIMSDNITCAFNSSLNSLFSLVSTHMLTCIVVDRYCVVAKVPRSDITTRLAHSVIAASWIAAVLLSLPWYTISKDRATKKLYRSNYVHCAYIFHVSYSNEGTVYSSILITVGYVLPTTIMTWCCVRIGSVIHRIGTGVQPASTDPTRLRLAGEVRTAKTVLIMVLVFILTRLPYITVGTLYSAFRLQLSESTDTILFCLFWTTGALMPLVYAHRNEYFSEFLHIRRQQRSSSPSMLQQATNSPATFASHSQATKTPVRIKQLQRLSSADLFNVMGVTSQNNCERPALQEKRHNSLSYLRYSDSTSRKGSDLSTATFTTLV